MDTNEEELFDDPDDLGTVVLTLDDDTDLTCSIICIFPVDGRQYIALLPIMENDKEVEPEEILIYRFIDNGEDEPDIENIEDDDEYDAAFDAFNEILDEEEFGDDDDEEADDEES
ncbi:MAG: DUF1292 domain-containing protein [Lachnospiraceae bacterium]|nr:DUF1292 domain-containing protein [Lachnospiraceae bacterium]